MNSIHLKFKKNNLGRIAFLVVLALTLSLGCSTKSEVTHTAKVYTSPDLNSPVLDEVKKGTVVEVSGFMNHQWYVKEFIQVRTAKGEGFISPKSLVIGQDPEKSVFTWGKRKDYENFYKPSDKSHYKDGYEYSDRKDLPKEKISLDELLNSTGTKLEN